MRALVAIALGFSFITSGCLAMAASAIPVIVIPVAMPASGEALDTLAVVPSPEVRVVGDVRGVVLRPEAGGERIEFSEVVEVRWNSSAVVITGTVNAPGSQEHGQDITASFPLADAHYLIVQDGEGPSAAGPLSFLASIVVTVVLAFVLQR